MLRSGILLLVGLLILPACETRHSQFKLGQIPENDHAFRESTLENINESIDKSSKNAELYYLKALILFESNQLHSATRIIEKAIELEKEYTPKYYILASKIYSQNQNYQKALDALNVLQNRGELTAEILAVQAEISWKLGRPRPADSLLSIAAYQDPFNPDIMYLTGRVKWAINDTARAIHSLFQSIARQPTDHGLRALFEVYMSSGLFTEAFEVYDQLVTMHPEDLPLLYQKASLFDSLGMPDKAKQVFRGIIQEHPGQEDAYYNLSEMYLKELKYDSAIFYQNLIVQHDSTIARPYLNLARIYHRRFWYSSAIDYYTRFIDLKPDNLLARDERDQVMAKMRYYRQLQEQRERISNAQKLKIIDNKKSIIN